MIFFKNFRTYTAAMCGHKTKRMGKLTAFGHTPEGELTIPINEIGTVDFCLKCIQEMTIKCAWCGNPIFIGQPVTLYTPCEHAFVWPAHAIVHNENPLQLVGCLGWNCAETGADRAGFWVPGQDGKGTILRVPTLIECVISSKSNSAFIINDMSRVAVTEVLRPTHPE